MSSNFYTIYATGLKSLDNNYVEGYISTGDKDLVNDIVTPGCLDDMLSQLQNRNIKIDLEHEAFRGNNSSEREINKTLIPAARITDAIRDVKGIKVITKLNKNYPRYEMLKGNLDEGFLDAFSIAYVPKKVSMRNDERYLEKVELLNVAFTGNPVNPEASFTSVLMKSLNDEVSKNNGGIFMKAEKEQENISDSKLEVKALVEKFDVLEKQVSELKSLIEVKEAEKEVALDKTDDKETDDEIKKRKELEAKKEADEKSVDGSEKEAEAKSLELETKLKSIEAKHAELDKVLNSPIYKARVETMLKSLNEDELKAKEVEEKSRGPLDLIK